MNTFKIKTDQKRNLNKSLAIHSREHETKEDTEQNLFIQKADKTKNLLFNVFTKLDNLNSENFDILFPELLNNMKEATILRNELVNEIGEEELLKKRPELFSTAKLIEKKYDNTIEIFLKEEERLERELNSEIQKKKLIAYKR